MNSAISETITIREADLADPEQAAGLVAMLDAYMRDPMEGGVAPSEQVKRELIPGLRAHPACCAATSRSALRSVFWVFRLSMPDR